MPTDRSLSRLALTARVSRWHTDMVKNVFNELRRQGWVILASISDLTPVDRRDLLEDVDLQVTVRHHLLQATVFLLKLAQALYVGRFQAAKVLPPAIDRLGADAVLF